MRLLFFFFFHSCLRNDSRMTNKAMGILRLHHPLHEGLVWSWHLPSSRTGRNQYNCSLPHRLPVHDAAVGGAAAVTGRNWAHYMTTCP